MDFAYEEEGVEEVLRYWPKADLGREPDPEPFGDFGDFLDVDLDKELQPKVT